MGETAHCRCVTVRLPGGTGLTAGGVRLLVRFAQKRRGAAPWEYIAAEEFRARRGTLLIARPVPRAQLADYALPFLHKYFMN